MTNLPALRGIGLLVLGVILGAVVFVPACKRTPDTIQAAKDERIIAQRIQRAKPPENVGEVQRFFAAQELRARAFAAAEGKGVVPELWPFFATARNGDWQKVTRLYYAMSTRSYHFDTGRPADERLISLTWQPVNESFRFYEQCANGSPRHILAYAHEIIGSLPKGAVLLTGTDQSRFVVSGLCRDYPAGDPVFVISQNALADSLYVDYLRTNFSHALRIPTMEHQQQAFADYVTDAERRLQAKQLKPSEDVKQIDGRTSMSGQVAVMEVSARVARSLFYQNPQREFFVVEGFSLDWLQPLLEPHGFVLRIRRDPVTALAEEVIQRDRAFWAAKVSSLLGDWLTPTTSVQTVCAFTDKVFARQDLNGFAGDKDFVTSGWPWQVDPPYTSACSTYAHARVSSAGIYARLAREATDETEKARMETEADFAYRQAIALSPYSPEAVFRYVNFLGERHRWDDALAIIKIGARLNPEGIGPYEAQVAAQARPK